MRMFVYLLDLKQDEKGIAAYLRAHENVEAAISKRLKECGVIWARVLRAGDRLVSVRLTEDAFDPARFDEVMASDPACVAWNKSMEVYQQPLPSAEDGQWWAEARQVVFDFKIQHDA